MMRSDRAIRFLILLSIFASPMGAQAFSFSTPIGQMSIFRFGILSALLIMILVNGRRITITKAENKFSCCFMYAWFGYSIISAAWARDYDSWFKYLFFFFMGILSILLIMNYFPDRNDLHKVIVALNLGVFVQSIIGWSEVITRQYHFISERQLLWYGTLNINRVPIAMATNPNDFAMVMMIGICLSYVCVSREKNKLLKVFYHVSLISYCVLLILTTSRAMMLALAVGIGFILVIDGRKKIGLLVIAVFAVVFNPSVWNFIISQFVGINADTAGDSIRVNLIFNGFDMLLNSLGFGVGIGQIPYYLEHNAAYSVGAVRTMHNWWVEILASSGVIFFAGYLIFYIKMIRTFMRRRANTVNREVKKEMLAFSAFLVAFSVGCISSSSNFTFEIIWVLWAVLINIQGTYGDNGKDYNELKL